MTRLQDIVRVGKALSDRTRIRILAALGVKDLCVCELTELVGPGQPAVSRHLGILRDAGLVEDVRDGKWVNYRLIDPAPHPLAAGVLTCMCEFAKEDPDLEEVCRMARVVDRNRICGE